MSSVLGTVSKALLMYIVARRVRCADFDVFTPSCTCYVSVMKRDALECLALKPCWVGEGGIRGVFVEDQLLKDFKRVAE